jgi:hypothetical protein
MKSALRYRVIPLAALVLYSLVHVLVPALHRHHISDQAIASHKALSTNNPAGTLGANDCDDEDSCPICSVLHQAQVLAVISDVRTGEALQSEAFAALPLIRPNPVESVLHSRAPPAV